jgi:hypothetical protein
MPATKKVEVEPRRSVSDRMGRLPTRTWRVLALVFLVLSVLGILTSQSWGGGAVAGQGPPFKVPKVANQLLSTDDVSSGLHSQFLMLEEGPPNLRLFQTEAPLGADLRQLQYEGGWERKWTTPDSQATVSAHALQYRTSSAAQHSTPMCRPEQPFEKSVEARSSGTVWEATYGTLVCADLVVGRIEIWLDVLLPPNTSKQDSATTVSALLELQQPRLVADADNPLPAGDAVVTRLSFFRTWLLALIGLALLSTLPSLLFDRATGERLLSLFSRHRKGPGQTDVEPAVSRVTTRYRALGLARFAVLVWVLRLSEELNPSPFLTFGMMFVTYLITVLIARKVMGRLVRQGRSKPLSPPSIAWLGAGLLGSLLVFTSALWLFNFGASLAGGGFLPEAPNWIASRWGVALQFVAASLFFLAFTPLALARRMVSRRERKEPWNPKQAPVLFLRSFVDDKIRMRSHGLDRASLVDQLALRRWERFEEVAAISLSKYGPVLAASTPGERLPPGLGATRIEFSHEEWEEKIYELMNSSIFIAVTLGRSQNLVLEMSRIRDMGYLHKTVFLIPPVKKAERRRRLAVLAQTLELSWRFLDTRRTGRTVLAVCLPLGSSEPMVITSRGPDDLSYDEAIAVCANALRRAGDPSDEEFGFAPDVKTATDDMNRVSAPPLADVVAVGRSKPPRTWKRNPWVWNAILQVSLVSIAVPYLDGDPLGSGLARSSIEIAQGYSVTDVAGQEGDISWIILNGSRIARADFLQRTLTSAGDLPVPISTAAVRDGVLFYVSTPTGKVGAWRLESQELLWQQELSLGVRSLAFDGNSLLVASPATGEVVALGIEDGRPMRRSSVGGSVWDLTVSESSIIAVILDRGEVAYLDRKDLSVMSTMRTVASPSRVIVWNGLPLVQSQVSHQLVPADQGAGSPTIWITRPMAEVATDGATLVVEGVEQISTFAPGGLARRFLTEGNQGTGLSVRDGVVVVADGQSLLQFKAKQK